MRRGRPLKNLRKRMVSGIYSHEAAVFGSPWTTLGAVGSENWGPQGLEGGWRERGYGMIRSRPHSSLASLRTSFALLVQAFPSVKQVLGAGGLTLGGRRCLASPGCQVSSPLSQPCLSFCWFSPVYFVGRSPRGCSPELWVAQMGERAREHMKPRGPCVS